MNNTHKAFSLIELMVAVAIIALLSGIVMANLGGARSKARDTQRISDIGQLQLALAMFYDRCGQYPTGSTLSTGSTASTCPSGITLGSFIAQIPTPPGGAGQTNYDYTYYRLSANSLRVNYILHAKLEAPGPSNQKSLPASAIYDPSSSINTSPYGWSQAANAPPYSNCSNSGDSTDYCVGPN